MKNTVHFVVQGKGGIGKSFVAVMLAQYFASKGAALRAFDTDQENTTFAHYKNIGAEHVPVMNESRTIDPKRFDSLMEKILLDESGSTFVIDNGANTFSPLLAYMVENGVIEMLRESGKAVYLHTIVGGGDVLAETANGFNSIASAFADVPLVLWLNEHFGKMINAAGVEFTQTSVVKQHKDSLRGMILLPDRNRQTFGEDIKKMNVKRLTLDEVKTSTEFGIMEKQRIRTVARDIFEQLDEVVF